MSVREIENRAREVIAMSVTLRRSPAATSGQLDQTFGRLSRAVDQLEFVSRGGDTDVYSPRDHEDLLDLNEFQAGRGEDLIGAICEEMERLTVERDKRAGIEAVTNVTAA